jgi:hypothetical protein
MTKQSRPSVPRTSMTPADAARIQSTTARKHGGLVPADSFASRAQAAAARSTGAKGK